jgi:hypothetical protein
MKFRARISQGLLVAKLWPASGSHAQNAANLQLRLQADAAPPTGSPTFSLLLANDTDDDVYIPVPGVNCEDDYSGWVQLHMDFRPLSGRRNPEVGEGCATDRMGPLPPILDRLSEKGQEWQLLQPGDALSPIAGTFHPVISTRVSWGIVKAGQQPSRRGKPAFQDDGDPGVYQLWAIYHPPVVGAADLRTLQEGSIDIPRSRVESTEPCVSQCVAAKHIAGSASPDQIFWSVVLFVPVNVPDLDIASRSAQRANSGARRRADIRAIAKGAIRHVACVPARPRLASGASSGIVGMPGVQGQLVNLLECAYYVLARALGIERAVSGLLDRGDNSFQFRACSHWCFDEFVDAEVTGSDQGRRNRARRGRERRLACRALSEVARLKVPFQNGATLKVETIEDDDLG